MACPNSEGTNAQCTRVRTIPPISSISTILGCYMLLTFGIGGEKMSTVI